MKTEYLLKGQVDLILAALLPQNRVVIKAALHTGLRLSDLLALKPEQIKPKGWITERKTGKRRQVGFPEQLRKEILQYSSDQWAFPGRYPDKPRTRQAVWRDVKRVAKALRFPQNVAPHSARKVYAVELMKKYGDIAHVRRALNHSSDAVTMVYALADHTLSQKYPGLSNSDLTSSRAQM